MLLKSDTVHDAWAATQRTVGIKLTIKETEYDASDITSLTFDSGALNGEALSLGSTYQNTIKVVFSHLIEGLALTDEIAPKLCIKLPDGTWDYTPLGVFVIDAEVQQDRNNNTTTVSASDRMCMMGGTYESKLTYPAAINDIAVEIANLAAVKINEDDFARLPTDKVASFGKVTYRDAIGFVAQFAGGFATFDRDGLLDIRQLADPNFDIAPGQYQSKGLTKNEALYRIGGIACTVTTTTADDSGNETQDTTTLQSGSTAGTQITISNPGMTQDLLDGLYEQLQDLNFYPFSLSWFGDPNLEAGDWIELQDTAGNTFKTPNLLYSLTFSGGVTATSKADTTVSASASFVYKGQLNQIVENIRQYLNASGQQVSEGLDEPLHPKAGDVWFKKSGPDTYIMMYKIDPETGIGSWVEEVSTKGVSGLDAELKAAKAKLNADILAAQANLATAQKDVAALQTKLATNDQTQAQITKDLAANVQLVTANKQSVDATLATVNKTLTQAQTDTATAVKNADLAVTNAQSAVDASGLATKTANAASDAAIAAKTLATSTAANFTTVQSQAKSAASDAATALSNANSAMGQASTAIGNASDALTQAKSALATASSVQTSMQPAITTAVDKAKGELTASIKTVQNGLDNLHLGGTNLIKGTATFAGAYGSGSIANETFQGYAVLRNTPVDLGFRDVYSQKTTIIPLSNSYTLGFWAKSDANGSIALFYFYSPNTTVTSTTSQGQVITDVGDGHAEIKLTTEWVYYWITWTQTAADAPKSVLMLRSSAGQTKGNNFMSMPMLVEGNKPITWQPAPEDVQSQITTNTTKITANSKEISLAAKQSTVDTLSQTVTDQGAKLDLTATAAQLKLTDNKVDALNKTVSDNSAQLKLTATSAALETQSKRVDTISGAVSQNQADIKAANGAIELKASNSRVDTLEGTVKQQGIDLKAAQGELKLKITQNDLTKGLDGYATQAWAQNKITATAQGWEAKLSSVQSTISNTTIGTRNYILNSDFETSNISGKDLATMPNGSINVIAATYSYPTPFGTHMLRISSDDTTDRLDQYASYNLDSPVSLKTGETWTYSYYYAIAGSARGQASDFINDDSGGVIGNGSMGHDARETTGDQTTWHRFVRTFVVDRDRVATSLRFGFVKTGTDHGWVCIDNIQLEKSSIVSDHHPAPEDSAVYADSKVASLKLTVDGLASTFAKQSDLQTVSTKTNTTANGLSAIVSVTGSKAEKVTALIADVNKIQTTMTGSGGYSTRLQTLEGFQQTATTQIAGKATTAQLTQLSNQLTSTIGSISTAGSNLVVDGGFESGKLNGLPALYSDLGGGRPQPSGTYSAYLHLNNMAKNEDKQWYWTLPKPFILQKGHTYIMSYDYCVSHGIIGVASDYVYDSAGNPLPEKFAMGHLSHITDADEAHRQWHRFIGQPLTPTDDYTVTKIRFGFITAWAGDGWKAVDNIQIQESEVATPYQPAPNENSSTFTQLQNQIDLRTKVDGKVTAALNLSNDGGGTVTIRGASLYVTADSHFDNASIQSAAIANLNADKITSGSISSDRLATTKLNADNITSGSIAAARIATTALSATNITSGTLDVGKLTVKNLSADLIASGTLDASNLTVKNLSASSIIGGTFDGLLMTVKNIDASSINTGTLNAANLNVIGLNASAITTGTIKGANLAINLNSGEVLFTKGSIKSTTGTLDIEIEDGTFSQRNNSGAGFLMSQGNLYFSATSFWDALDKNEYALSTLIPDYGYLGFGDMIATKRGMALYGKDSLSLGLIDTSLSVDYFDNTQGFISIKKDDSMAVNGGGKGLILVGGTTKTGTTMPTSPSILVGSNASGDGGGNRIYIDAEYFHVPTSYSHTSSGSANMIIKADGAIVRTSSATKYKSNIERFRNTDMGETLLSLPQAHWYNKQDMQRYVDDPQHYQMPQLDYGMIAEDLASAGLEDLVVRGDDGELEDIRYDRIAPALLPLLAKMKQEIEELKSAAKSA